MSLCLVSIVSMKISKVSLTEIQFVLFTYIILLFQITNG